MVRFTMKGAAKGGGQCSEEQGTVKGASGGAVKEGGGVVKGQGSVIYLEVKNVYHWSEK